MRKSWDHYFMDIAYMAASRATCPRRHVGAILVKEKKILGTAYNGAPAGVADCYEAGCILSQTWEELDGKRVQKTHCIRPIHAEQNLLLFTDREDRQNATVYVTDQPCWTCTNMLANSGIGEIVYRRESRKDQEQVEQVLRQKGIVLRQLEGYTTPPGLLTNVIE